MHSGWELLSHGTGSAASCSAHTCFNEESELYTLRFLSCELSHTRTRVCTHTHTDKNSHLTTLNYMDPQLNPQLWHIFVLGFSNVPIFYSFFFPHSLLPTFFLLLSPPCFPVFLCGCSLSPGNARQQALLCKCLSQEE